MAITHLILIRHGESVWNVEGCYQGHLNSPLTPAGLEQSRALAARLAKQQFGTLYSSDLGRALQTAEIIATQTAHPIVSDSGLRERHLGVFQGLLNSEIRQKFAEEYRRFKEEPDYVVPDGESAVQASARMIGCLAGLARRHAGECIVLVTHGGVASALFRHTLGLPPGAPRRFERPNASWNVFRYEEGKWFLKTWGDVSHLQATEQSG